MCFTCPIVLSNASIPQWPVGSNGVFLTGRLGVSHMAHIPKMDHLSRNNTSGPPWHGFQCSMCPIAPYRRRSSVAGWEYWEFLTGRLRVSPIRQTSGLNYMVKYYISSLMCFTCPIMLSNASISEWPVGSNGVFLNGRLGVSHIMDIPKRTICPEITHQVHLTWFSMFNVPYRPIQPSFLNGRLGVMGVPHWPVESLTYQTDIGMELYGEILHI